MKPVVAPEFRPTLGDLLRPRVGARALRIAAVVALVVGAVFLAWLLRPADDGIDVVRRAGPATFNLRYTSGVARVAPRGDELLRLEGRRGSLFLQSFTVAPFVLPQYRGDVGGTLPVLAAREIEALRRRFAEFELVQDGKARVNEVAGYAIAFRARQGKRRLYGRVVLLPVPAAHPQEAVALELLTTPAAGVSAAGDVGTVGAIKRPYRSFRFGAQKP